MDSHSSSPTMTATTATTAQQESLEEAYVRLCTQLLLHLQRREISAALRMAEVIRDVLLDSPPTAEHSNGSSSGSGVAGSPSGADLFHGSPAEQLLQLRGQLKTLASAESTRARGDDDLDAASESQSTSSETGNGNSTVEASSDDDDVETDETGLASSSEVDDDVEKIEEVMMVGSSSSHGPQQQQQQTAARLLAEVLKAWPKASTKPAGTPPAEASSSVLSLAKSRTSKPGQLQPRPPLPCHKVYGKGKDNASAVEEGRGLTMPGTPSPLPPLLGEGVAGDEEDESLDADAEAVWVRMQAQVATEMNRLAIVRKHR
ncbi:hypothetical protein NXY56_001894 [Leishmania guyanensis]|uniref:Uncharacterized protein n=1 Tax=Leishmania guyanensis TaxID=5670 RepID=A0A1E1IUQ0_LEIGU|nr:hypothetical protein, conserved [Leishmania guyanensis]